jgi:hypothetical protein
MNKAHNNRSGLNNRSFSNISSKVEKSYRNVYHVDDSDRISCLDSISRKLSPHLGLWDNEKIKQY